MPMDEAVLSAFLDGEVPEPFTRQVEELLSTDAVARRRLDRLHALKRVLKDSPAPDFDASQRQVLRRIEHALARRRGRLWSHGVRVPLPALIAAGAAFAALLGLVISNSVPLRRAPAERYLASGNDIPVTIKIDGAEMEHVLQWLNERDMLGEVNIELPSVDDFRFIGEPVLLKPGVAAGVR